MHLHAVNTGANAAPHRDDTSVAQLIARYCVPVYASACWEVLRGPRARVSSAMRSKNPSSLTTGAPLGRTAPLRWTNHTKPSHSKKKSYHIPRPIIIMVSVLLHCVPSRKFLLIFFISAVVWCTPLGRTIRSRLTPKKIIMDQINYRGKCTACLCCFLRFSSPVSGSAVKAR